MSKKVMRRDGDERIVMPNITEDLVQLDRQTVRELCAGVPDEKKRAFIIALAQLGNRTRAAQCVGISVVSTWLWRQNDPEFNEAYRRAMMVASELREDEAYRRATEGVLEPVFQGGQLVGSVRRFSDTLLIFGLKGDMPEKYADRQKVEHSLGGDLVQRLRAGRERALGRGDKKKSG